MKKLYSAILVANLMIEGVGASVLFAAPQILVDTGNSSAMLWAWNYGFVALAVGSAVFWTWSHRDSFAAAGAVLGILFSFHLAIAVALTIADTLFADVVVHGVFAVLCLYLYTQRPKWCLRPQAA
ncbi:hypothetical protein [Emcibacter sp. SYSU 3D8]|uniref:hypothetical protein n=1 Tax=Emcibacter sp. SYSU 3D8 TaxID=3133969 RepID=UPI0031FF0009